MHLTMNSSIPKLILHRTHGYRAVQPGDPAADAHGAGRASVQDGGIDEAPQGVRVRVVCVWMRERECVCVSV